MAVIIPSRSLPSSFLGVCFCIFSAASSSISAISTPEKGLCSYFLVTTNGKSDWLFCIRILKQPMCMIYPQWVTALILLRNYFLFFISFVASCIAAIPPSGVVALSSFVVLTGGDPDWLFCFISCKESFMSSIPPNGDIPSYY